MKELKGKLADKAYNHKDNKEVPVKVKIDNGSIYIYSEDDHDYSLMIEIYEGKFFVTFG